jgi:hypothetical protein
MAAQQATMVLLGTQTGRTYSVDVYAPDAAATLLTFNGSGPAASTSADSFRAPENCLIQDISIAASPTATGVALTTNGNVIVGGSLRWANQLVTTVNRKLLQIPVRAGDFIGGVQFA